MGLKCEVEPIDFAVVYRWIYTDTAEEEDMPLASVYMADTSEPLAFGPYAGVMASRSAETT